MDIEKRLDEIDRKLESIRISVDKTRRYFAMMLTVSIIAFCLPLVLLAFAAPFFISTYLGALEGLV